MFKSGFVSIIGRPNVGKSTFLNAVLQQKIAIMSDKPQTTRNRIQGFFTEDDAQIIFIDTPGIHKPKHKLGEFMVNDAVNSIGGVDLILYLIDVTTPSGPGEKYILELLAKTKTPVIAVLNKIDTISQKEVDDLLESMERTMLFKEVVAISALNGDNVPVLIERIKYNLPEGPQYYPADQVTDQPEKAIIAEFVREKILTLTQEEVPHAIAVETESVKEEEGLVKIQCIIYVERESQKGIVIGKNGKVLKEVGTLARKDIEELLDSKVFLELWVKVKKDWRNKDNELRNLGFKKEKNR